MGRSDLGKVMAVSPPKVNDAGQNRRAILVMCAGVFFIMLNDTMAKWLVTDYTPFQILFVRSVLALPLIVVLVIYLDRPAALKSARLRVHVIRGVLGVAATYAFIFSLGSLPLAEATSLLFAAPLFVTALSSVLLGDRVGLPRWAAVMAGFLGVLVIIRPGAATFEAAALWALAAAFLYALVMLSARWIDQRDNFYTMTFYITLFPALYCSFVLFTSWPAFEPIDGVLFLGMALCGTLGVTLLSQAFRMAPAAVVAPFDYTALIWASVLGWLIWGTIPDLWMYAGAAIIVISGIYLIVKGSNNPD